MIGFGIIGTGAVVAHHIKSIRELGQCRLVALSSSSAERASLAASKYSTRVYSDYRELLKSPEIDAVIICTASGNHLEPCLAAAKAGKHVLVEKPLEVTMERSDQMISACALARVKLGCIFQNRFAADYQKVKSMVENGQLGKLTLANAYIKWYRPDSYYQTSQWKGTISGDGGAALINQGIHTIDLLLDCAGSVERVFSKVRTVYHNIEGEDLGVALLQFKNGALGTIEASTSAYPGYPERLEIFGTAGSVVLEGGKLTAQSIKGSDLTIGIGSQPTASGAADPNAIGHQLHKQQIKDFVQAILEDRPPLIDGKEGRKALELIMSIYESSKLGKEILL